MKEAVERASRVKSGHHAGLFIFAVPSTSRLQALKCAIIMQRSDIKPCSIDRHSEGGPVNQSQGQLFSEVIRFRLWHGGAAILESHSQLLQVFRAKITLAASPNDIVQPDLLWFGRQQLVTRLNYYKQNLT